MTRRYPPHHWLYQTSAVAEERRGRAKILETVRGALILAVIVLVLFALSDKQPNSVLQELPPSAATTPSTSSAPVEIPVPVNIATPPERVVGK